MTTPITAAALYFSGVSLFSAAVFLFYRARDGICFRGVDDFPCDKIQTHHLGVSLLQHLCPLISATAFAGLRYSGAEDALMSLYSGVKSAISSLYFSLGSAVEEHVCSYAAREIITMLPAYAGILSLTLAYISDILASLAFRVLDCEDVFISMSREITMPKTFALVYIASAVMFFLTSGSDFEARFRHDEKSHICYDTPVCGCRYRRGIEKAGGRVFFREQAKYRQHYCCVFRGASSRNARVSCDNVSLRSLQSHNQKKR